MTQISRDIINERSKELSHIVRHVSNERNKTWLGWKGRVLVDEVNNGFVTGRNFAYKPVVIREDIRIGSTANVVIVDTKANFLVGEVIN